MSMSSINFQLWGSSIVLKDASDKWYSAVHVTCTRVKLPVSNPLTAALEMKGSRQWEIDHTKYGMIAYQRITLFDVTVEQVLAALRQAAPATTVDRGFGQQNWLTGIYGPNLSVFDTTLDVSRDYRLVTLSEGVGIFVDENQHIVIDQS